MRGRGDGSQENFDCILVVERVIALLIVGNYLIVVTPPIDIEKLAIMAHVGTGPRLRLPGHCVGEGRESGSGGSCTFDDLDRQTGTVGNNNE